MLSHNMLSARSPSDFKEHLKMCCWIVLLGFLISAFDVSRLRPWGFEKPEPFGLGFGLRTKIPDPKA